MDVLTLGQVFTPPNIVEKILSLRKNQGRTLEPSVGDGAFFHAIPNCNGIEIDPTVCPLGCLNADFFDYPTTEKFDTIIGNPPYVAYKHIRNKTNLPLGFDERTNLYIFFIRKSLEHLNPHGEIIFITPRDFIKATSSRPLNKLLYELGTITDFIDLGDLPIFKGYTPNCAIWRFEKDNFSRQTNSKTFMERDGQLLFLSQDYTVPLSDVFDVRVGAVSGMDEVFVSDQGVDFVYSATAKTGMTRKMLVKGLEIHKDKLLNRRIRKFTEQNWWEWGRMHHISDRPRVYVNCKTRRKNPFFVHPCNNYDGSVLALFSKKQQDVNVCAELLNRVNWDELGFVCDGRFLFSQRSLATTLLPSWFHL